MVGIYSYTRVKLIEVSTLSVLSTLDYNSVGIRAEKCLKLNN